MYILSVESAIKENDDTENPEHLYNNFTVIEKVKLFKLVLFCFITGNEDMHLKNFSIINQNGIIGLSPCYDLLNTTIELKSASEEIALSLKGKKTNLTIQMLIDYFGGERCELNDKVITNALDTITNAKPKWFEEIQHSFLSDEMKKKHIDLVVSRFERLRI